MSLQDDIFDVMDALPEAHKGQMENILEHLAHVERKLAATTAILDDLHRGEMAQRKLKHASWRNL